ncbi:hypothetical protein C9426_22415 [Serratia sp. S1B]|nr:hypothetical protein C9426_22415 [Serratia sp. S1B]
MKKLVVLDGHHYPEGEFDKIKELCSSNGIAFDVLDCVTPEDAIQKAQDADAAICIYLPMDDNLLKNLPNLRMVVRSGIGVDNLDLSAFTKNRVLACNVPDYGVEEVAIHALSLLLALERKIVLYNNSVHNGEWDEGIGYAMRRVSQRTVGLLGFGRIARKLSCFLTPLGYSQIAFDPHLPSDFFTSAGVKSVSLDFLLQHSDILVVMAPLNEETHHLINDKTLLKTKDGLFIINTARGALVDTHAVIRALDSGKLQGVGFDVLEEEPPTELCQKLLGRHNIILTPHIGYRSLESFEALKRMAAETAISFLKGGDAYNVVNKEIIGQSR